MSFDANVDLASLMNLESEGWGMFSPDVVERVENLRRSTVDAPELKGLLNAVSEVTFESQNLI